MTRLDSANAANFGCDEGMPGNLLFAADARMLDVSGNFRSGSARLEVTSVAHAEEISYGEDGCTLAGAVVQPGVRVDTVELNLRREDGRWASGGTTDMRLGLSTIAFAGALRGLASADWDALAARADSIRQARNQPLARPWPAGHGHYDGHDVAELNYPDYREAVCPVAAPPGSPASGTPEVAFAPYDVTGVVDITGIWFAAYETEQGGCIAPVSVESTPIMSYVCSSDPSRGPPAWTYKVEGLPRKPALLFRNVPGIRPGPSPERYTVVSPSGRPEGVSIFSARGEVLRIVEIPAHTDTPSGSGYYLNVWYRGRLRPFMWIDDQPAQTWDVYWVGLLNEDEVPDLVMHTTRRVEGLVDHRLSLLVSASDPSGTWKPAKGTRVVVCGR